MDLHGTLWLVLIAHVFFNVAVVVRTVGGLWGNLDPSLEEAARTLGASPGAGVPRGDPAAAAPGHRRRRPRSCSCSASRRSAWCCCWAGPGPGRSRSRSTTRPPASCTSTSPPCWPSCSSSAWASRWWLYARHQQRRSVQQVAAAPPGGGPRSPDRRRAPVRGAVAGRGWPCCWGRRSPCWCGARSPPAARPRCATGGPWDPSPRGGTLFVSPLVGGGQLAHRGRRGHVVAVTVGGPGGVGLVARRQPPGASARPAGTPGPRSTPC